MKEDLNDKVMDARISHKMEVVLMVSYIHHHSLENHNVEEDHNHHLNWVNIIERELDVIYLVVNDFTIIAKTLVLSIQK
jgi:hypothetical protein